MNFAIVAIFAYGLMSFLLGLAIRSILHLARNFLVGKQHKDRHIVTYTGPSMVAYNCSSYDTALIQAGKVIKTARANGHQLKQLDIDTPLWEDQHGHQVSVIGIDSAGC